ncbi:MAG: hypothetical protein JST89_23000 [Cyanobacteria bacterium SZAS-4]|nr:hypothetical protein [Cyanobacteria bacterium SZAS-4]
MSSSVKSAIILSVVCLIEFTSPVLAQVSSTVDALDELSSTHSKIVDVDIVTNSPTLQSQSLFQQPQTAPYSSSWTTSGAVQSAPLPQQSGMVQQSNFSSNLSQYATGQYPSSAPGASSGANSATVTQSVPNQPIQVDSQTVGRVVGVAGTALLLGAFLKNGGVGGMMNTFGLDNRFHSRGSSLAPY